MSPRRCIVKSCPSVSGKPQHRGVTFHTFPINKAIREIWQENSDFDKRKSITKSTLICSRHFRRADFQPLKHNKYFLKQGAVPTIFPWGSLPYKEPTLSLSAAVLAAMKNKRNASTNVQMNKDNVFGLTSGADDGVNADGTTTDDTISISTINTTVNDTNELSKKATDNNNTIKPTKSSLLSQILEIKTNIDNMNLLKRSASLENSQMATTKLADGLSPPLHKIARKSLDLSVIKNGEELVPSFINKSNTNTETTETEELVKTFPHSILPSVTSPTSGITIAVPSPTAPSIISPPLTALSPTESLIIPSITSPAINATTLTQLVTKSKISNAMKSFDPETLFVPGNEIEAQDFNNVWHHAKVVEVDSDEREVKIHFDKNIKTKQLG